MSTTTESPETHPHGSPTDEIGASMARSATRFDEADLLRRRLRVLAGAGLLALALGLPAFYGARIFAAEWRTRLLQELVATPGTYTLVPLALLLLGTWVVLARKRPGLKALRAWDALLLWLGAGHVLWPYSQSYDYSSPAHAASVAILVLLVLARALCLPSGRLWSFALALPLPLVVLAIQLYHGHSYPHPQRGFSDGYFAELMVLDQLVLWGAALIGAASSRRS